MLDYTDNDGDPLYLRCTKDLPSTELESMAVTFGVTVQVAVLVGRFLSIRYLYMLIVLIRPRWKEVAVPVSWLIPEVADTVFSTPDDGCCDARNM
jgi:hypothetical protein